MTPSTEHLSDAGSWMRGLAALAQNWLVNSWGAAASARTPAYVDLLFSFGLARLGENDAARELLARAKEALTGSDEAHQWLLSAFEYRIRQALEGMVPNGPFPAQTLASLDTLPPLLRFVVDRMRKHSSVLEPDQRINPYRHWGARISDFEKAIAELTDLTDRNEIANRVEKLLREVPKGARGNEQKARVLRAGLEAAPRVGEEFARKLLDQTVPAYDGLPEAKEMAPLMEQATFLEKALFVAGHFRCVDSISPLVARFQQLLHSAPGTMAFVALEGVAKSCLWSLHQVGMQDAIDQVLQQMADRFLKGSDVETFNVPHAEQGAGALRFLLVVAGHCARYGRVGQAEAILLKARSALLANDLSPHDQTQLACSYAATLGEMPAAIARECLEELVRELKGIRDAYTTASHFSIGQLDVVESVVLAAVEVCSRR